MFDLILQSFIPISKGRDLVQINNGLCERHRLSFLLARVCGHHMFERGPTVKVRVTHAVRDKVKVYAI